MKLDPKNVPACEIALEIAEAYVARPEELNLRLINPDGTGPGHASMLRMTRYHLTQSNDRSQATWLTSMKYKFAEVATEDDSARLRRALVGMGAELIAWIASLDGRRE